MPISLAETTELTCPHCHYAFPFEVWLIIDVEERPDLVERIRAGILHALSCPQCDQAFGELDVPLLIFRPRADPLIIFSPAQQTTNEQDYRQANGLVVLLQERLGDAWRDTWIANGMSAMERQMLLVALAHNSGTEQSVEDSYQGATVHPNFYWQLDRSQASSNSLVLKALESRLAEAQEAERRFLQNSDSISLDAAVTAWNKVIEHPSFDFVQPDFRLLVLNDAGRIFLRRYWVQGQAPDLNQALALWTEAIQLAPPDWPDLPSILNNFGTGLRARYARTCRIEDLDRALHVYKQALDTIPEDSHNRPLVLNSFGNGLRDRYIQAGQLKDLEQAISIYQQALDMMPSNAIDHPVFLSNLGTALRDRYMRTGRLEDLEQAISIYQQAVNTTPEDSPAWPSRVNNFGNGLRDRYAQTGQLKDLEQSVSIYQQAVDRTPSNATERSLFLNNLGNGLIDRYMQTGRLEDLEQAIDVYQQAVDTTPGNAQDRSAFLNNFGTGLRYRYAQTGRLEDLEQAVSVYQQAVNTTPKDSPVWSSRLNNLGNGLRDRYARTGRLEDLEQAISLYQQAMATTSKDSPIWSSILNNLGTGLSNRYARTGRLEDLKQALIIYQQVVEATPVDSPERPIYLTNIGNGLSDLYARTGQLDDLEQAINVYQQAVDIMPKDSSIRSSFLNNLGSGLNDRYARTGQLDDLERAVNVYQQAVDIMPEDSPDWPIYHNNLGNGLRDWYKQTRKLDLLERALVSYKIACKRGTLLAPEIALIAAQTWGRWASERIAWGEAVQAFEAGITAIEQLHRAQLRRRESETWLNEARGLHMCAAYALVQTTMPEARRRAVEVAEIGRARGLGETLARDRSDLSEVEQAYPDTYERYHAAAEQVRQYEQTDWATPQRTDPSGIAHTPNLAALILAAREQLDTAVDAIRTLPDYGGFLRAPSYAEIAATARPEIPLVYLITTLQGSLALIVSSQDEEPKTLLLDGFTEDHLDTLLITRKGDEVVGGYLPGQFGDRIMLSTALDAALPLLGKQLIAPLAAQLREIGAHGVTLIPTGLLGMLPLHAATYAVGGETCCLLDEFDVAYAPSARVLATAQREAQQRQGSLHLAGVGNPTGDLRYAWPELASICDLLPASAFSVFPEQQARRNALWQALTEATIVHLACHGQFANDPLDSALYLAGGDRITLRELVTGDMSALSNLHLVVMSACQTAITDFQGVPDESIGLPGGFLQAGVPAVVGTLWSVNDLSTALLMYRFYELHLQGDSVVGLPPQPPVRALRLAQLWLRDLSYQQMYDYFDWHAGLPQAECDGTSSARMSGPLIDEGILCAELGSFKTPTVRPYAHPFAWAAFTFSGAMEAINGR